MRGSARFRFGKTIGRAWEAHSLLRRFVRGITQPDGFLPENPSASVSFVLDGPSVTDLRGCVRHRPLRGGSARAALPQAKIPRRRIPRNFQTGSQPANHRKDRTHVHGNNLAGGEPRCHRQFRLALFVHGDMHLGQFLV